MILERFREYQSISSGCVNLLVLFNSKIVAKTIR